MSNLCIFAAQNRKEDIFFMTQTPQQKASDELDKISKEELMKAQSNTPIEDDGCPWYALRLFTLRQMDVVNSLADMGMEFFVPMQYVDYMDREGRRRRKLRPVVSNLLFVKKTFEPSFLSSAISDLPYKMMVVRKSRGSREFCEIPSKQMYDFRVMCNPELLIHKYMSEEEAKLKVGTKVMVTHGPLKGLTGKLVRQSHKYYLLKEVPGMAVMIKVTRWCCQPMEE